jgi:protein-S-isoprenylcysteine O-methyltransferase Ste14
MHPITLILEIVAFVWLASEIVLAVATALVYRIRVEEAALEGALGEDYVAYRKSTRSLVPGIY